MSKHTPGPWWASHCAIYGPGTPKGRQAIIAVVSTIQGMTNAPDNARLIAAAPDLLEACRSAFEALDDRYDVDEPLGEVLRESPFQGAGKIMRFLRQAIAKAEGRET